MSRPASTSSARQPIRHAVLHWCAALLLSMPILAANAASTGYQRYFVGNAAAHTPGPISPGLLLLGGGDRNFDALRWFLAKAGHGHVVVLRASQSTDVADELFHDVGGVASVETFVFSSREAATDPKILASLARADGIFIAGGDQARYVRFWKDTPVARALDAHVRAGKPLGGTSAGLAILGEYVYGAMDDGSITSTEALTDPLGPAVTIEHDFLHLDLLHGVVTDTHFKERDRLGRLFAFLAKARRMSGDPPRVLVGVGVDESAALAVEGDGAARVYATDPHGGAWVVAGDFSERPLPGQPLHLARVNVLGVGAGSTLHLPRGNVDAPSFRKAYAVGDGQIREVAPMMFVMHGGAGLEPGDFTPVQLAAASAAFEQALRRGHAALDAGKSAVDAVAEAIVVLEDDPHFNAGRGAVFTHDGKNELDASIMDGATLRAGAVAGVHHIRNPILLAKAVMEHSPHVLMIGDGAEAFARQQGFELVDPAWFRTEKRWQDLQWQLREDGAGQVSHDQQHPGKRFTGTVGAVALDLRGGLAAGTSTGGMLDKRYGRVGDAPIIGAGTYANGICAVSSTGWGEYYIRTAAAHDICARMAYLKESAAAAGDMVINRIIPALGGDGGAIVMSADGRFAMPFNTNGMFRGWIGADGVPHVAIFRGDDLPLPPP